MGRKGVHPDGRLGLHGIPWMKGFIFLVGSGFISAASSGASASLGMDVFSRGQRETQAQFLPGRGCCLPWRQPEHRSRGSVSPSWPVLLCPRVWEVWGALRKSGRGQSLLETQVWSGKGLAGHRDGPQLDRSWQRRQCLAHVGSWG